MSFDAETLYRLLPAIHRIRDEEREPPGALKALLSMIADQLQVMEENLDQLHDDLFIETCADWVIPYIGDLIGYEPLHPLGQARGLARAEVAHTIALRRRKGTAAVLEQLARDVTGWNARAVEFFQLLGTTQYMNHLRPANHQAPDLRRWETTARIGTAFDRVAHTVDVRRIENGSGRHNIPNVGLFLWRLAAYRHTQSPAVRLDDRRYVISPLGAPLQLFTQPRTEDEITRLADPINVPDPIRRRVMADRLALYAARFQTAPVAPDDPVIDNADPSLILYVDGVEVARDDLAVCNLQDDGAAWAHPGPADRYAIDPMLGRVAVGADLPVPTSVALTYHHGFSADMGGGEYSRPRSADADGTVVLRVPGDHATIAAALAALGGSGVVEVTDSGRYAETLSIAVNPDAQITLRAAEQTWPTLVLGGECLLSGGAGSAITLEGLLVAGERLRVPTIAGNVLARLDIVHCTLVPGRALDAAGEPLAPTLESLAVEIANVAVTIDHAIAGALRVHEGSTLSARDSIIDATATDHMAFAAPDGLASGGTLSLDACTLIGRVRATALGTVSNSILLSRAAAGDPLPAVHVRRRQTGCVRFSYLPFDSATPRRYRCQPDSADTQAQQTPRFTSLRYGHPAYGQLARATAEVIRRGAEDESEMGAFHALFPAQREANLRIRLDEYLRVGLSAGIFYET